MAVPPRPAEGSTPYDSWMTASPAVETATAGWPMVGRHAQLEEFELLLDDPRRHAIVVRGGVGAGKTRFAEECLALAARRGHPSGRATGTRAASAVPFGAVAHLLPVETA